MNTIPNSAIWSTRLSVVVVLGVGSCGSPPNPTDWLVLPMISMLNNEI